MYILVSYPIQLTVLSGSYYFRIRISVIGNMGMASFLLIVKNNCLQKSICCIHFAVLGETARTQHARYLYSATTDPFFARA